MSVRKVFRFGLGFGVICGTVVALSYNQWDLGTFGIVRFGRAALTAGKIIADYKVTFYKAGKIEDKYDRMKSEVHKRSALRLLDLCCANGGTFIKVGQHLGALDYLLPEEYVQTLKILHSQAPKSALEDVFHVIKEDLRQEPSELFSSFEPEPIGAASLAQVHKAVTKNGTTVAVKVQHRFVKTRSFVDMKTMEALVHLAAWIFPDFQLLWLAEETKKNLPVELDFINEGKNAERIQKIFSHYKWFKVPAIYWELSAPRVLTMEYCEGGQVNDKDYMDKHGISPKDVSQKLGKLYSEMIFLQGYIHCDPHPGNILIDNSKGNVKIVLLDHGLYTTLTDDFRLKYARMWLSLLNADTNAIQQNSENLGIERNLHALLASMITARAWKSIKAGISKRSVTESEDKEIKAFIGTYLHLISKVLNQVPREMLLIFKTNDLLRSIEYALKSPASASSFITMSRCCVRALVQDKLDRCESFSCRIHEMCICHWTMFKIRLYELYIWFQASLLGHVVFRLKFLMNS